MTSYLFAPRPRVLQISLIIVFKSRSCRNFEVTSPKKNRKRIDYRSGRTNIGDAMAVNAGFKYRVRGVRPGASEHLPLATQSRSRMPTSVAGRHGNFSYHQIKSFLPIKAARFSLRFHEVRLGESSKLVTIGEDHEVIVVPGLVAVRNG